MKTAVISLDLINEITHRDGKIASYVGRIESECIISHINQINQWARKQGHLVIHVRVGFDAHYTQSSVVSPIFKKAKESHALCLTEWGCEYHDQLEVMPGDVHVIKHRISAFYGTDLDLICRANQIERVILTGVSTSMAVELTAREAHDRDYHVVVVTDATTCASDEEKQASLFVLKRLCEQTTTAALIS
jgi:nicotinamidase-related amidase